MLLGPILMLIPDGPIGNDPQVAVAPGGRALVVWTEYRAGTWYTVARRVDTDGSVGRPLDLALGSAEQPAIPMDRRGVAVVAWTDYTRVVARRIRSDAVSPTRVIASGGSPTAASRSCTHRRTATEGS